jgi:hypothetical protein
LVQTPKSNGAGGVKKTGYSLAFKNAKRSCGASVDEQILLLPQRLWVMDFDSGSINKFEDKWAERLTPLESAQRNLEIASQHQPILPALDERGQFVKERSLTRALA